MKEEFKTVGLSTTQQEKMRGRHGNQKLYESSLITHVVALLILEKLTRAWTDQFWIHNDLSRIGLQFVFSKKIFFHKRVDDPFLFFLEAVSDF
jgi:hypothetical protein